MTFPLLMVPPFTGGPEFAFSSSASGSTSTSNPSASMVLPGHEYVVQLFYGAQISNRSVATMSVDGNSSTVLVNPSQTGPVAIGIVANPSPFGTVTVDCNITGGFAVARWYMAVYGLSRIASATPSNTGSGNRSYTGSVTCAARGVVLGIFGTDQTGSPTITNSYLPNGHASETFASGRAALASGEVKLAAQSSASCTWSVSGGTDTHYGFGWAAWDP